MHELEASREKNIGQLKSLTHAFSFLILECVSCKNFDMIKFTLKIFD